MLPLRASCLSEGHGTSLAVAAWGVLRGATCVGRVCQRPLLRADSRRFVGEELLSRKTVLCLRYLGVLTNQVSTLFCANCGYWYLLWPIVVPGMSEIAKSLRYKFGWVPIRMNGFFLQRI